MDDCSSRDDQDVIAIKDTPSGNFIIIPVDQAVTTGELLGNPVNDRYEAVMCISTVIMRTGTLEEVVNINHTHRI